jgi:DNA (cytosine-5)-methyltransferase 1
VSNLTFIDLFSGCGGASLGLKLAGYKAVAAVDNDPIACKTYEENLGLSPICADLRRFDGQSILEFCSLKKGDIDLIVGCPPCQGFSSLRRTAHTNGRGSGKSLVALFANRIAEIQPKAAVLENVPGIAKKEGIRYLKKFISKMQKMGYRVRCSEFNAADYGVPQFRKRIIVLCTKGNTPPPIPYKTHSDPQKLEGDLKPWRTVRDAIGDLPPLRLGEVCYSIPNHRAHNHSPRILEIIKRIPKNGGSRHSLPTKYWLPCHLRLVKEKNRGAESVYGRMAWDQPSPTITCRCTTPSSGRFLHPEQDRAITPREAARLQCFPDDFIFPEGFSSAERLIGNAVPPLLMSIVGKSLKEVL